MKRRRGADGMFETLERRLARQEADDPDGPLALYRWMWRTLERTSHSTWRLRARFAWLVAKDLTLLSLWAVLRPFLPPAWRMRAVIPGAAALLLLGLGVAWPERDAPPPGIPEARMVVYGHEALRFEGQMVRPRTVPRLVEHYGVRTVRVDIDPSATADRVFGLQHLLAEAGVERLIFEGMPPS